MRILKSELFFYLFIWLVGVFAIAFLGYYLVPVSFLRAEKSFFESFSNWDADHFLTIAQSGYSERVQYAFFPLYPISIKFFSYVFNNLIISGLIASLIFSSVGVYFFHKLLKFDYKENFSARVLLALLVFPTSFYFLLIYSESLFFLTTILSFYLARKKRKDLLDYCLITLFAAFASATRILGVATILGIWTEVFLSQDKSRLKWIMLFAPLGLVLYGLFLFQNTGNPFYFLIAEQNWSRELSIPGSNIINNITFVITNPLNAVSIVAFLDLFFTVFGLGMVLRSIRFLRPSYYVYAAVSILIPLMTPVLGSMPRFLLPIFPIFILLASIKRTRLQLAYVYLGILLQAVYIILYINKLWVS